jgi:hypothetical protein
LVTVVVVVVVVAVRRRRRWLLTERPLTERPLA